MPEDEAQTGKKKGKGRGRGKGKGKGRGRGKGKGRGRGKGKGRGNGKKGKGGRKATKKTAPDFELSTASSSKPEEQTDSQKKKGQQRRRVGLILVNMHSLPEATAPAAVEPTPKRRKGNPDAVKASPAAPVVKPPKKGGEENKKGKVAKTSKHQDEREKYDIPTYTHCAINAYWSRDAVGVKLKVGGKLGKEAGFVTCAMYIICRTKAKSL